MIIQEMVVHNLIMKSFNSDKLRLKRRSETEFVIQANVFGAWVTLEAIDYEEKRSDNG